MRKTQISFCLFVLLVFALAVTSRAQSQPAVQTTNNEPIATEVLNPMGMTWLPHVDYSSLVLTISTPSGGVLRQEFPKGINPSFNLTNQNGFTRPDGHYTYELRLVPVVSGETRAALTASRESGHTDGVARELFANGQLRVAEVVQAGTFLVTDGAIVSNASTESTNHQNDSQSMPRQANAAPIGPLPNSQTIATDLIVQGSACVGLDCVTGESFGFDTLRLKENNLRIKFADTSTSAGFPNNSWQLTANDSASGGANKFSIDDVTGGKTPFTVIAGAPTNSFFLDSFGRLGLRTATPGLDIHMNTRDTPAVRFEQNSSGGFTAQTWDIGANEANFFVRDLTGGSKLPFRVRPGAPTSSIDISASGNVGIGTASPAFNLDVAGSLNAKSFFLNGSPFNPTSFNSVTGTTTGQIAKWTDNAGTLGNSVISESGGNVGVGITNPSLKLQVAGNNTPDTDPVALALSDPTNGNERITLGYDIINHWGTIQSINTGVAVKPLLLNPRGGTVGVGYTNAGATAALVVNGNVGIGTTAPQSTLQVNGYIQLALTSGAPPAVDCDNAAEYGRMKVDAIGGKLYVCISTGWKSTTLAP
jgi:hypothetical protein